MFYVRTSMIHTEGMRMLRACMDFCWQQGDESVSVDHNPSPPRVDEASGEKTTPYRTCMTMNMHMNHSPGSSSCV